MSLLSANSLSRLSAVVTIDLEAVLNFSKKFFLA